MDKKLYLLVAKMRAKEAGYNPDLLKLANDKVHKLSYDGVKFGNKDYNDYILYSWMESQGRISPEEVDNRRRNYRKRATNIKGNWRNNPISPNNLAIRILW